MRKKHTGREKERYRGGIESDTYVECAVSERGRVICIEEEGDREI